MREVWFVILSAALVILSAAKDLAGRTSRSFAEFTLSEANVLRMTRLIAQYLSIGPVALR